MKPSLLVIEDDITLNQMLVRALERAGYEVASAGSWSEGKAMLDAHAAEVVLLDLNLPDSQGFGPLMELAQQRPTVMLTAYGSINQAVEAMRLGAVDYLVKPVNLDELELVIQRALDHARLRSSTVLNHVSASVQSDSPMVGQSSVMQRMRGLIATVGDSDVTALVTGESGVGKELVAQAIHAASSRRDQRFVAVDCCTLQESLFESELFGFERGAFTGADRRKPGLIEAAAGGSLFLDEIGDIGPAIQAKLLRVLETGRFRRLGAVADQRSDARIIAATNRNLLDLVQKGQFRADLYYRLNAFAIEVPPLRERPQDIGLLVEHFASTRARRNGSRVAISAAALAKLAAYDWPGNVRELRNVVDRAILLAGSAGEVLPEHLPELRCAAPAPAVAAAHLLHTEPTLDALERQYLQSLLLKYQGNRRKVAQAMGVSERTAYRMLDRHGLRDGLAQGSERPEVDADASD